MPSSNILGLEMLKLRIDIEPVTGLKENTEPSSISSLPKPYIPTKTGSVTSILSLHSLQFKTKQNTDR